MLGWFRKRQPPFVGIWVLVKAGDHPPDSMGILSMRLVIAADGSLTFESQMRGPWDGMTLSGNGTWSVAGDRITFARKEQSCTSVARVEGSRLVLEPDFVLVRDENIPVVGVYERAREAQPSGPE